MTVLIIPANGETVSQKKNIMKEFETDVENFASLGYALSPIRFASSGNRKTRKSFSSFPTPRT